MTMQNKALLLLVAGLAMFAYTADAHCAHVVKKGENLFDIAQWNGYNESQLIQLNPQLEDPELIYPGNVIKMPCEGGEDTKGKNIFDLLQHRKDTFLLLTALSSAGMLEDLEDGDLEVTLFAPTDAAFEALLKTLELSAGELLNDTTLVKDVLAYHVVPGDALEADDLDNNKNYNTLLEGKKLKIKKNKEGVFVLTVAGQEVPVKVADLEAGDAVVHLIEEVLLPLEQDDGADAPTAAPKPTEPTKPTNDECTYIVESGDTLFEIAQSAGITLEAIIELNPQIEDPELIRPGDEVILKEC